MTHSAHIEAMLYGGTARASDGAVVPASLVLPGEQIATSPLTILQPSPDRVAPRCVHFSVCGGCHYQHASYPAQLAFKQGILGDVLHQAQLADLPGITVHAAGTVGDNAADAASANGPWQYRNRIRLRIAMIGGVLRVGYSHPASADSAAKFLPITMCPIAAPLLWRAAETLIQLPQSSAQPSSQPSSQQEAITRWLAAAVEVELFTTPDEGPLQMTLFVRSDPRRRNQNRLADRGFDALAKALQRVIPQLTGAAVAILPKASSDRSRRTERPKPGPQWGTPGLSYPVHQRASLWVSRGGFFQVNRRLVERLEHLVTANRTGTLAWDLYAGVGLFACALTARFSQVVAVEVAEPAASDLAQNLKRMQRLNAAVAGREAPQKAALTPTRAVALTTLDFLQAAVVDRAHPDLIVMDPPRAGLGAEVCALLARVRAHEMVYVSCDPVTLARDLKLLTASGYTIAELHLVDMFPQTFHIETVAILRRQTIQTVQTF